MAGARGAAGGASSFFGDASSFRVTTSDLELGGECNDLDALDAATRSSSPDMHPDAERSPPRRDRSALSKRTVAFSGLEPPEGTPDSSQPRLLGRPDNHHSMSFGCCRSSGSFDAPKAVAFKETNGSGRDRSLNESNNNSSWGVRTLENVMMRVRTSGPMAAMTSMPTDRHQTPHRFPLLDAVVRSRGFEATIAGFIVINCVTMGLEVEVLIGRAGFYEPAMRMLDNFFAIVFLVEFILRVLVFGWRSYIPGLAEEKCGSVWNLLEAIVVLISCCTAWFVTDHSGGSDGATPVLQALTILRALRLVRVVRVVSRVKLFHEVWLLLRGLSGSMRVLFWTVVVIFFITYMFAVFGVVLISDPIQNKFKEMERDLKSETLGYSSLTDCSLAVDLTLAHSEKMREFEQLKTLHKHTNGIWQWMFTLVQVLTLDSWMSIARPMQAYIAWSWAFFYLYIAVAVFVLMNLVTAIIVENALKSSQKDAEEVLAEKDREKKGAMKRCRRLFQQMDEDNSGTLSLEEFTSAFEDPGLKKQLEVLDIHEDDAKEIFKVMDTGDGVLELEEFFEGITRMQGPAQARDMFRVLQITQKLANDVKADCDGSSANLPGSQSQSLSPPRAARRLALGGGVARVPSINAVMSRLDQVCSVVQSCDRKLSTLAGTVADLEGERSYSL